MQCTIFLSVWQSELCLFILTLISPGHEIPDNRYAMMTPVSDIPETVRFSSTSLNTLTSEAQGVFPQEQSFGHNILYSHSSSSHQIYQPPSSNLQVVSRGQFLKLSILSLLFRFSSGTTWTWSCHCMMTRQRCPPSQRQTPARSRVRSGMGRLRCSRMRTGRRMRRTLSLVALWGEEVTHLWIQLKWLILFNII